MTSDDVAALLSEIADLLELKGENEFKIRAYRKAAQTLESLCIDDMREFVESGELKNLPGFGKALIEKVTTFVKTGKLPYYDKLISSIPPGLLEMLRLRGLGPKRIRRIYQELGISTIGELEYACHENRLLTLKGFGKQTQAKILKAIQQYKETLGRYLLPFAEQQARNLAESLSDIPEVKTVEIAGSIRRRLEVVRDLDLVVLVTDRDTAVSEIRHSPYFSLLEEHPKTRLVGALRNGLPVELWVVEEPAHAAALVLATGSTEFVGKLHELARRRRLRLEEDGLFSRSGERVEVASEAELFARLGLPYIPPELRESRDIADTARRRKRFELVELDQFRGVLHVHSTWSDGINTISELAEAALELGYSYLGISDHSQSAHYANGLSKEEVLRQHEEIEALNRVFEPQGLRILKGIEADILPDGSIDYPDEILERFDFVIASVHSRFDMDREAMTERIVRAVSNRYVSILGHPTGRLLLARPGYQVDMERVLRACAENNVIVEINSHPQRLDLDWRMGQLVHQLGLKVAVNPDAHSVGGLHSIEYGVGVARKAGLSPAQVINTWRIDKLLKWFKTRTKRL